MSAAKVFMASSSQSNWEDLEEFLTREEAIEFGQKEGEGPFFTGRRVVVPASSYFTLTGREVIDNLRERSVELEGEEVDAWLLGVSDVERDMLRDGIDRAIDAWAAEVDRHPNFHPVVDIERHENNEVEGMGEMEPEHVENLARALRHLSNRIDGYEEDFAKAWCIASGREGEFSEQDLGYWHRQFILFFGSY